MNIHFRVACCLAMFLSGAVPPATADDLPPLSESMKRTLHGNFSGWSGIVFMCRYDGSKTPDALVQRICDAARGTLERMAASHRVSLSMARDNDQFQQSFIATADRCLPLTLALIATPDRGPAVPRSVHASLSYSVYYDQAIEQKPNPNSLDAVPRKGYLEVWSQPVIAQAVPVELADLVVTLVSEHLEMAVDTFAEYGARVKRLPESASPQSAR